jgi:hypothetical protein
MAVSEKRKTRNQEKTMDTKANASPTLRTAISLYVLCRKSWGGNWNTALCDYGKLSLPNVTNIVRCGNQEEAQEALESVAIRGAYFAAKAQDSSVKRLNDADMWANAAQRCRIAYRALLIIADPKQDKHHAALLVSMIGDYLQARYIGPTYTI